MVTQGFYHKQKDTPKEGLATSSQPATSVREPLPGLAWIPLPDVAPKAMAKSQSGFGFWVWVVVCAFLKFEVLV